MPKADADLKKLQRALRRLEHLGSALLHLASGPHLVAIARLDDPQPLIAAWEEGRQPTLTELKRAARLLREPLPVGAATLKTLGHDLIALRSAAAQAAMTESPRLFRRRQRITGRGFATLEQEVQQLARALAAPLPPPPPLAPAWTAELCRAYGELHGAAAAKALHDLLAASLRHSESARAAGRRLQRLLERLHGGPAKLSHDREVEATAKRIEARFVGGAVDLDHLQPMLAHLLLGPGIAPPLAGGRVPYEKLGETVTEIGGRLLALLPDPLVAEPPLLARTLAAAALLFDLDADAPPLGPRELGWLAESLPELRAAFGAQAARVPLRHIRRLLPHLPPPGTLAALARHLAAGLGEAELDALLLHRQRIGQSDLEVGLPALQAFADWIARLRPLCLRLGIELDLQPSLFEHLGGEERSELLVLASSLLGVVKAKEGWRIRQNLELIEMVASLCRFRPALARELFAELAAWTPGRGRAAFPAFADWLGADPQLDQLLHLQTLAGESPALSHTLLEDFELGERQSRELAYLEGLAEPGPRQLERWLHLRAAGQTGADPARTRRRLAERLTALETRILHARLQEALDAVLRRALGRSAAELPPSWRAAARFLIGSTANQQWLGELLQQETRHKKAWPLNADWIGIARGHFAVDAWLAPRRQEIELQGVPYLLHLEEDPLEVLKMGSPFNTCLSLENGFNAASVVLNAIDANKRVLYLRDAQGAIVGRRLLAVSQDWQLLGYHFYCSLAPPLRTLAKAAADQLCAEIAAACGLPPSAQGKPAEIHPGYWYDDRPQDPDEPLGRRPGDLQAVSAFCASFGLPAPPEIPPALFTEALAWEARAEGNFAAAIYLLDEHLAQDELHLLFLLEGGQEEALWQRAAALPAVLPPLLEAVAWRGSPAAALRAAARAAPEPGWILRPLAARLRRLPPSPELARALVAVAQQNEGSGRDSEGWAELALAVLPAQLGQLPLPLLFELALPLAEIWQSFARELPPQDIRRDFGARLKEAACRAYQREGGGFALVLEALRGKKGELARELALAIAARFPLSRAASPATASPASASPASGGPAATRGDSTAMLAALTDLRALPAFATAPELLAALLRQAPAGRVRELRLELPRPAQPPFAALGDLLDDPALAPLLEELLQPFLPRPETPPAEPAAAAADQGGDWEQELDPADPEGRERVYRRRLELARNDRDAAIVPWREVFYREIRPLLLPELGLRRACAGLQSEYLYRRLLELLADLASALAAGEIAPAALLAHLDDPPRAGAKIDELTRFWLADLHRRAVAAGTSGKAAGA